MHLVLHGGLFWRGVLETAAWGIALAWVMKTYAALQNLPAVTNLAGVDWDIKPARTLSLTVVVPAKDEAETIAATLDALVMADYRPLRIVAVDDRSTDGTGAIMEECRERARTRDGVQIDVVHLSELADGWLGKTFALMVGTEQSRSDYVLYTDADVLFSPSILRRSMAYVQASEADHMVVLPTMLVKSRGEGIVLGFFQVFGLWASRPWRVEDAESRRDIVGVGAFNLVRRSALEELGGWLPQRMAVLEDITLGRRMKAAGMRQRMAFAPGFVLVHWAKGAKGLLRGMTKNLFSAFNFNPLLLIGALLWIVLFCLLPLAGLGWPRTIFPALLVMCCIGATYRAMGEVSLIDARYGWLYPLGAVGMIYAMLRSMVVVLWQRGVVWRGTLYELRDLRRHNSPFAWEREAAKRRDEAAMAMRHVKKLRRAAGKKSQG